MFAFKQNLNVDTALCRFLLAYRNTEHSTTGDSPANILQARNLRMRLDKLKPDRDSIVTARQAQSVQNAGGVQRHLEPGTNFWYRDYNKGFDKWLPGIIVSKLGKTDYQIKSVFGTEIHRHIDQLKLRVTENSKINLPNKNIYHGLVDKLSIEKHSRKSLSLGVEAAPSSDADCDRNPEPDSVVSVPSVSQETEVKTSGGGGDRLEITSERIGRVRKPPTRYDFEFD